MRTSNQLSRVELRTISWLPPRHDSGWREHQSARRRRRVGRHTASVPFGSSMRLETFVASVAGERAGVAEEGRPVASEPGLGRFVGYSGGPTLGLGTGNVKQDAWPGTKRVSDNDAATLRPYIR